MSSQPASGASSAAANTPAAGTPSPATPTSGGAGSAPVQAVPQHMLATLASFHASQNAPQATQAEATAQFLALPADRQRQIHSTYIARQRITSQAKSNTSALHPSLSVSTNVPSASRPGPSTPALASSSAAKLKPKELKKLRIEVPETREIVSPLTSLIRTATASNFTAADNKRSKDDGLRGSMRGEIARLLYAAGDVPEPDVDTVDYMEDMALEFIADLCRPAPPMRSNPNAPRQHAPLTADILRHRLASHSYLKKYLDRWDEMTYMWQELQQSKRVAQPSHTDLIQSVGKQFLGLDEEQPQTAGVKRRAVEDAGAEKKRGRPPKAPEERKKPGPKKGWKKNLDPNAPPKKRAAPRPYKKKERTATPSATASPTKQG